MQLKAVFVGIALASTPFLVSAVTQDPVTPDPVPLLDAIQTTAPPSFELRGDRSEIEKLRAALQRAEEAATDARQRSKAAVGELDEALTIIANGGLAFQQSSRSNACNPSRARIRNLITQYEWMKDRGHETHATTILTRVVKENGTKNSQLDSLARDLMTNKETSGKFNRAALALAELMQKRGSLKDSYQDTVALAMFLNGRVSDAVAAQTRAIKSRDRSEYRRRLMVYQAALKNSAEQTKTTRPRILVGGGGQ